ncbi:MAG: rod-binding protein [Candidatus Hydrogenedentes bacterium]|nr:rod-binding protein [Candidatus Hydrogenedentota bacterium]
MLYINPLAAGPTGLELPQMDETARKQIALRELEHYFAFTLLQEMRKTVPRDPLLDGGAAQRIFEEMLDDVFSGEMAESGQLGIAKHMAEQLRMAEIQTRLDATGPTVNALRGHA